MSHLQFNEGRSCKVCQDAGKPMSIYTSHNVKYGCPTLATTRCRKCKNLGHTTSYCTATIKTQQRDPPVEETPRKDTRAMVPPTIKMKPKKPLCWADMVSDDESD